MTTEFQADVSLNESDMVEVNIGNELKAKRVSLNLDERQVATELKIPIDQVRALESNRFSYFRSNTFARGYLKSYCRLLQLDVAFILNAFDRLYTEDEPNLKPVDKVNKQAHFGDPIVILVSIVIVLVLVFLAFWWPTMSTSNAPTANTDDTTAEVSASPSSTEQTVSSEETASTTGNDAAPVQPDDSNSQPGQQTAQSKVTDSSITSDSKVSTTEDDGVVTGLSAETIAILEKAGVNAKKVEEDAQEIQQEQPEEVLSAPIYTDDIEVKFDADCWTEIRDSSDKILYSGVKSAGSSLALTGTPPYRVVLGFAKGVSSFKYKGNPFDFSSFVRKDLARFELK